MPYKDFIFSAFAEEQGFVGVVVVLSLYFVLLMRIVQNAQMAPDRAGHVYLHGDCGLVALPYPCECGNGGGHDAGDRHSAAVHELWRFQYLVEFFGSGAGEQCPPQKVCELEELIREPV